MDPSKSKDNKLRNISAVGCGVGAVGTRHPQGHRSGNNPVYLHSVDVYNITSDLYPGQNMSQSIFTEKEIEEFEDDQDQGMEGHIDNAKESERSQSLQNVSDDELDGLDSEKLNDDLDTQMPHDVAISTIAPTPKRPRLLTRQPESSTGGDFLTRKEFNFRFNQLERGIYDRLDKLINRDREDSQSLLSPSTSAESGASPPSVPAVQMEMFLQVEHENKVEKLLLPKDKILLIQAAEKSRTIIKILLRYLHPGSDFSTTTRTGRSTKKKSTTKVALEGDDESVNETTPLEPLTVKFCVGAVLKVLPVDRRQYSSDQYFETAKEKYISGIHHSIGQAIADIRNEYADKKKRAEKKGF